MGFAEFRTRFPRVCDVLARSARTGRVGQAYLLCGDQSELLGEFALAWAWTAACQAVQDNGEPCGQCAVCRRFGTGGYEELRRVRPLSKSRQISVDAIRDFERSLSLKGRRGFRKIGLIEDADTMNAHAQNAFLKTLEEPPPRTLLLLTTCRPRMLLPTIRSRCQVLSLAANRRTYEMAAELGLFPLLAGLRPNAGAGVAMRLSQGLGALFQILRKRAEDSMGETAEDRQWAALEETDATIRKQRQEEREARRRSEYLRLRRELTDALRTWFDQLYLVAAGVPADLLPHPELIEQSGHDPESLRLEPDPAERCRNEAERTVRWLDTTNANEQLLLDGFCLSVCERI